MPKISRAMLAIVLGLLSLGIVMIASTSTAKGISVSGDPHFFLKKQLVWLFIAIVAGIFFLRFDYHWLQKSVIPLALSAIFLLFLVSETPLGVKVGGSYRWLRIGPLSFQPSEFAKYVCILAMSAWMAQAGRKVRDFKHGFVYPLCGVAVVLALTMREPDFGASLQIAAISMLIMFAAGTKLTYLLAGGLLGFSAFLLAIMRDPVRWRRIVDFFAQDSISSGSYQSEQAAIAFKLGGLLGKGLGNSIQKQYYLPEAHTDFILAIIGEELGLFFTLFVVLAFTGMLVCGLIITFRAPDTFGRLLAFGITMLIVTQAAVNIGVVTGCLPTKGLALPFISYGGSSLLMTTIGVSILINISQHVGEESVDDHTRVIKDSAHVF